MPILNKQIPTPSLPDLYYLTHLESGCYGRVFCSGRVLTSDHVVPLRENLPGESELLSLVGHSVLPGVVGHSGEVHTCLVCTLK